MRVLITGVTGFVGSYLADYLSGTKKIELFGLRRPGSGKKGPAKVEIFDADVRNGKTLQKILKKIKPERVFHLAGAASAGQSWKDPAKTFENNIMGTRVLLEALSRNCPRARVHVASSAEVYGFGSRNVRENASFQPMNPYAVSKIAQEALAQQYFLSHRMAIIRTRAFNHIGPKQNEIYVTSNFAKQVAAIEAELEKPVLRVGNLSAIRDFTDVRDVARAYWLCLERGKPGDVYNVCSGKGHAVSEILQYYLRQSAVKIAVRKNKALYRRIDAPALVGDPAKLRACTGWRPRYTFEQSLRDILAHWRKKFGEIRG